MTLPLNVLVCSFLAGLRLSGTTSELFQAVAHCYVMGLFVVGWFRQRTLYMNGERWPRCKWYWRLAWALSFVELYAALHQRGLIPF